MNKVFNREQTQIPINLLLIYYLRFGTVFFN